MSRSWNDPGLLHPQRWTHRITLWLQPNGVRATWHGPLSTQAIDQAQRQCECPSLASALQAASELLCSLHWRGRLQCVITNRWSHLALLPWPLQTGNEHQDRGIATALLQRHYPQLQPQPPLQQQPQSQPHAGALALQLSSACHGYTRLISAITETEHLLLQALASQVGHGAAQWQALAQQAWQQQLSRKTKNNRSVRPEPVEEGAPPNNILGITEPGALCLLSHQGQQLTDIRLRTCPATSSEALTALINAEALMQGRPLTLHNSDDTTAQPDFVPAVSGIFQTVFSPLLSVIVLVISVLYGLQQWQHYRAVQTSLTAGIEQQEQMLFLLERYQAPAAGTRTPSSLNDADLLVHNSNEKQAYKRKLATPWPALFQALEQNTPPAITLLSLTPDPDNQQLQLLLQAADTHHVLAYATQLEKTGVFTQAWLQQQESLSTPLPAAGYYTASTPTPATTADSNTQRFTLIARWGTSNAPLFEKNTSPVANTGGMPHE